MQKLYILLLSAAMANCETKDFAQDLESDLKVLIAETEATPIKASLIPDVKDDPKKEE